jgi:cysteine desulfuration protein SufE
MADSLAEAEQELIDAFSLLGDWNSRYEYVIELGKELPAYPEALRTEEHEVYGCQSQVWLDAQLDEQGRLQLQADSNALITKGLVALLVQLYNGRPPAEVKGATLDFVGSIGLASHLTPSRVNGLQAMFTRIQEHVKRLSAAA